LGLCHDIQQTDRFLIFQQDGFSHAYVGEAVVSEIQNFKSLLKVPPDTPSTAFATRAFASPVIRIAVANAHIEPNPWFSKLGVELVDDASTDADLKLVHNDRENWVKFEFLRPPHGLEETFLHCWPLDNVELVRLFQQMGHFYYYIHRMPSQDGQVELLPPAVTLVRLDDNADALDEQVMKPDPHINNITANDDSTYGFKITNKSGRPLFFSLFYFDQSKFAIGSSLLLLSPFYCLIICDL